MSRLSQQPRAPRSSTRRALRRRRRGGPRPLGFFSYLVMCAIDDLPPHEAYGLRIEERMSERRGELVDLAAVYVTLRRLEKKDLLVGKKAFSPHGTAHQVKLYRITKAGAEAMTAAAALYQYLNQAAAG